MILTGDKEYYKGIGAISYEGRESDNPFSFKYYNPEQIVMGKTMREHFKFAIAYTGIVYAVKEAIHLVLGLSNFHGINPLILLGELKTRQTLHLN